MATFKNILKMLPLLIDKKKNIIFSENKTIQNRKMYFKGKFPCLLLNLF
jgi:hypothetical protein